MEKEFTFSHVLHLSEDEYASLFGSFYSRDKSGILILNLIFAAIIISISFFSKYTILLGMAISLCFIFFGVIRFLPWKFDKNAHRKTSYLKEAVRYEVSNNGFYVLGKGIEVRASWETLAGWRLNEKWLILEPYGTPPLFFRVDDLKKNECFDLILENAQRYGGDRIA